jgi:hypothetical protein
MKTRARAAPSTLPLGPLAEARANAPLRTPLAGSEAAAAMSLDR